MCGRSTSALLLLLLLAPPQALARKNDFTTGAPFGFGFAAGLERNPKSDFTVGRQSYDAGSFGYFYSFRPFFDFTKVVVMATATWRYSPALRGEGGGMGGPPFTELSDAGGFDYGLKLMLAPWVTATNDSRIYLALGVARTSTTIKTVRTNSHTGHENTEEAKGTGTSVSGGLGWEGFMVQNYSLRLEGGYESRVVSDFTYTSSVDVAGTARQPGDPVRKPAGGGEKSFEVRGAYFEATLAINF